MILIIWVMNDFQVVEEDSIEVRAAIKDALDRVNKRLIVYDHKILSLWNTSRVVSKAAHVRKYLLLPTDFSLAGGELTPTLKVFLIKYTNKWIYKNTSLAHTSKKLESLESGLRQFFFIKAVNTKTIKTALHFCHQCFRREIFVAINALFPPIFFGQKPVSAKLFAFWMYGHTQGILHQRLHMDRQGTACPYSLFVDTETWGFSILVIY